MRTHFLFIYIHQLLGFMLRSVASFERSCGTIPIIFQKRANGQQVSSLLLCCVLAAVISFLLITASLPAVSKCVSKIQDSLASNPPGLSFVSYCCQPGQTNSYGYSIHTALNQYMPGDKTFFPTLNSKSAWFLIWQVCRPNCQIQIALGECWHMALPFSYEVRAGTINRRRHETPIERIHYLGYSSSRGIHRWIPPNQYLFLA